MFCFNAQKQAATGKASSNCVMTVLQSAYSCLAFVKVLWPEFSVWHLYATILHYQRNHSQTQVPSLASLVGSSEFTAQGQVLWHASTSL